MGNNKKDGTDVSEVEVIEVPLFKHQVNIDEWEHVQSVMDDNRIAMSKLLRDLSENTLYIVYSLVSNKSTGRSLCIDMLREQIIDSGFNYDYINTLITVDNICQNAILKMACGRFDMQEFKDDIEVAYDPESRVAL